MADELPEPLVPPEVDLTDFAFIPLRIEQLKRSRAWLKAKRRPELGFYMINLWTGSWHERPAASLENDDDVLADMARCDGSRWDKVKTDALHGWVLCSDGRLYHPVVAEVALEAWKGKVEQRARTLKARIAALEKRRAASATDDDRAHIDGLLEPLRQQLSQITGPPPQGQSQRSVTDTKGQGQGQGQGEGEGQGDSSLEEDAAAAARATQGQTDDLKLPTGLDRNVDKAFAVWNALAVEHGWPQADLLTSTRRFKIQAALAVCGGLAGWNTTLETRLPGAKFLHENGRLQRWVDLDWIIDADHFARLKEGRYAEARTGSRGAETHDQRRIREAKEAIRQ